MRVATTQDHSTLEGQDFIRLARIGGPPAESAPSDPPSFLSRPAEDGRAWGMVIDEDSCIGCNACVVACQSENNIPVVGKDQVALGREMHWLRIDRYYSGLKTGAGLDDPDTHFQPVPCMNCEDAPCEVGCRSRRRCTTTRASTSWSTTAASGRAPARAIAPTRCATSTTSIIPAAPHPVAQLQRNPEVTVRAKGVMEKCTYCVQRIAEARIESDKSGQPIADGAVATACQGACPTRAISFGDLNDRASAVRAARADPRHYALLGELNLKPRTTYLAERAPAASSGKEG